MKKKLKKVNRIEVIGNGREFVKYLEKEQGVIISTQDNGETLKIFIDKTQSEAITIETDEMLGVNNWSIKKLFKK